MMIAFKYNKYRVIKKLIQISQNTIIVKLVLYYIINYVTLVYSDSFLGGGGQYKKYKNWLNTFENKRKLRQIEGGQMPLFLSLDPPLLVYDEKEISVNLFSLSDPRGTSKIILFMFLINLRVKSSITKNIEDNIFEGMISV